MVTPPRLRRQGAHLPGLLAPTSLELTASLYVAVRRPSSSRSMRKDANAIGSGGVSVVGRSAATCRVYEASHHAVLVTEPSRSIDAAAIPARLIA